MANGERPTYPSHARKQVVLRGERQTVCCTRATPDAPWMFQSPTEAKEIVRYSPFRSPRTLLISPESEAFASSTLTVSSAREGLKIASLGQRPTGRG